MWYSILRQIQIVNLFGFAISSYFSVLDRRFLQGSHLMSFLVHNDCSNIGVNSQRLHCDLPMTLMVRMGIIPMTKPENSGQWIMRIDENWSFFILDIFGCHLCLLSWNHESGNRASGIVEYRRILLTFFTETLKWRVKNIGKNVYFTHPPGNFCKNHDPVPNYPSLPQFYLSRDP